MNTICKHILLYCVWLIMLIGCTANEEKSTVKASGTVKISIQNLPNQGKETTISMRDKVNHEQIKLGQTTLDSLGKGNIEFVLSKPTFVNLETGDQRSTLYLEPGYELCATVKADIDNPIQYTGYGAEVNNYLAKISDLQRKIEQADGRSILELDQASFFNRLDSLEKASVSFHKQYIESIALPKELATLLEKRNSIHALSIKQFYGWNYGAQHNNFNLPDKLNTLDEIPFDSILLNSNLPEYADIFQVYMHLKFYIPFGDNQANAREQLPRLIHKEIAQTPYPPFIKELLLAKNIDWWMGSLGIISDVDTLYTNYKKQYPASADYLFALQKQYDKWLGISPGKPATDFKGVTLEGKEIALSDLKGKIVYIDVWATWCEPCRKEIPFAKNLQKEFVKNDKVIFLNVSVDQNKKAWKKMISADKALNELHIINDGSIYESYIINGIPRYILIDQQGKIVKADAPRPSSGKVSNEINQLLKAS